MTDYNLWKKRVYQAIKDVSDLSFQRRAWLGTGPEVSSFVEVYCTLYDDCLFSEFLALHDTIWRQMSLTRQMREEMESLRQLMDIYQEPQTDTGAAILADPAWHIIVQQAQRVLAIA